MDTIVPKRTVEADASNVVGCPANPGVTESFATGARVDGYGAIAGRSVTNTAVLIKHRAEMSTIDMQPIGCLS